jgi:hypothetical protein
MNEALDNLIGQNVFIRTVTYHCIGTVEEVLDGVVFLNPAAYVADTGRRMADAFVMGLDGSSAEVERFPDGLFVSTAAIVDFAVWQHPVPGTM